MLYILFRQLFRIFFTLFFRLKIEGLDHIPKTGRVVIFANHISNLDPPLVGAALGRPLFFMAKEELFKLSLASKLLKRLNAFPVKRGKADMSAFKLSLKLLNDEKALCVFPEGTRLKKNQTGQLHSGAVLIAAKADAPIVPAAIIGPYRLFQPLRMVFGEPIDVKNYAEKKVNNEIAIMITQHIMIQIHKTIQQYGGN